MDTQGWTLIGPAALLLDVHDVGKAIGVCPKTIKRMIDDGEFPQGKSVGGKTTWTGADLAAWLHLRGRFVFKPLEQRAENQGQKRSKRGKSGTNLDNAKPAIEPEK